MTSTSRRRRAAPPPPPRWWPSRSRGDGLSAGRGEGLQYSEWEYNGYEDGAGSPEPRKKKGKKCGDILDTRKNTPQALLSRWSSSPRRTTEGSSREQGARRREGSTTTTLSWRSAGRGRCTPSTETRPYMPCSATFTRRGSCSRSSATPPAPFSRPVSPTGDCLSTGRPGPDSRILRRDYADQFVGAADQPFRIEEEAKKLEGTNFIVASRFKPHAVRDGLLITGQQSSTRELPPHA